jgi:iron complex outermembrane recepter protein
MRRRLTAGVAALLCSNLLMHFSFAADPPNSSSVKYKLDIPAENLNDALQALAISTHHKLFYSSDLVESKKSPALRGLYTIDQAVKHLLVGTGLRYEITADSLVMIRAAATAVAEKLDDPPPVALAQAQSPGTSSQSGTASAPQNTTNDQNQGGPPTRKAQKETLEEVIVTGSRIPEESKQQVQPVRSYTREDIEESGQTTVANFLNTLPDVSLSSPESANSNQFLAQTTVQLHGLPVGTTLVLLNGRRLESSYYGFFDLSNIPASAVERIDVLPVGASAIYGSDALGGAVNIILRTNVTGLEVNTKIAHADDTTERDVDIAAGKSWERGSVSFLGAYQDQTELLGLYRAPTSSITQFPANAPSLLTTDACFPGNVYSLNGQNLPGLSSPQAGIPAGIRGVPSGDGFLATEGKLNLCNASRYVSILPAATRFSGLLSAHYELSAAADVFTEVLASHEREPVRIGNLIQAEAAYGSTMSASNPYNPFGEDVGVSFSYPGVPWSYEHTQSFVRPLVGIRGSILSDWSYEATAYSSRDELDASLAQTYSAAEGSSINNALNSANPATALNPFSSIAPGSPQLLQSLILGYQTSSLVNRASGGQAILRGPLFGLPSGQVQTVFGAEYEHDTEYTYLAGFGEPAINLARNSYSLFGETRIPLLGNQGAAKEDGDRLVVTMAGRYDHSSDFGGKATWQAGAIWKATESVSLRAGYGTSYEAPLLQQISGGTELSYVGVYSDPFHGGESVSVPTVTGSNLNLRPETGESLALGTVYSSQTLRGLEASLSYFRIEISDYIAEPFPQVLIDYPQLFPGAVERAPPTAQDVAMGFLGQITQINDLYFNYGDLDVAGLDLDVHYSFDTPVGRLTPAVAVTDMVKWRSALTPGSPEVSYLSQATIIGPGFAPRWKGTAGLAWKLRTLTVNVAGRYLGRYRDYQDYVPNTNVLGNFWLLDSNARYDFGKDLVPSGSWASGVYAAVGAINLLNRQPQFSYSDGYDPLETDLRGRILYLSVGLKW